MPTRPADRYRSRIGRAIRPLSASVISGITASTPAISNYSIDTRHIHGANLGISAAAYRTAGGFAALKLGEDAALVSSLLARKADVRFAGPAHVSTSARCESTIEGGFAAMLRGLREKCIAEAAVEPLAV